jgi:hypothetical protein
MALATDLWKARRLLVQQEGITLLKLFIISGELT